MVDRRRTERPLQGSVRGVVLIVALSVVIGAAATLIAVTVLAVMR